MRQVWKPFEWAEMPRMACMPTGRPIILSWRRPVQSVHGMSSTISSLKAACASSAAMRRMLAAATPVSVSTFSGAYSADEEALRQQLEHRHRLAAVGQRERRPTATAAAAPSAHRPACPTPCRAPAACRRHRARTGRRRRRRDRGSPATARWCSAPGSRHRWSAPQQLVDQRRHEQAVGAGLDADPFVGDGVVAGAHRVDRHDLDAALLQLAERRS